MRFIKHITIIICPVLAALVLLAACAGGSDIVWLEDGSQGQAGNRMVYDLDSGAMYLVRMGQSWFPVKSNGTLGKRLLQLNHVELNKAQVDGELESLDVGITKITGLSNDFVVCVYKYGRPTDSCYLVHGTSSSQGANQFITGQKNMVIDLGLPSFTSQKRITFMDDVIIKDSVFIFVTADLINLPQSERVTGSSAPEVLGGVDWYYAFGNMDYTVSSSNPFKFWVSDQPGQTGYFSISGPPPSTITKRTKRASSDHDRPPT